MKLIRVDAYEVVVPARPGRVNSEEYGPPIWDMIPKLIVELHTDAGLVGLGEGPRGSGEATLRSACAQLAGLDLRTLCFQEPPLLDLGCYRREERHYTPHITLGRVKSDRPADRLALALAKQAAWKGGETTVREVLVMSSELRPQGPVYTVLSRARFKS